MLAGLAALPGLACAASLGDPAPAIYAFNLRQEFALPALHNSGSDLAGQIARGTQVYARAQILKLDDNTADAAWAKAPDTVTTDRAILPALSQLNLRKMTFSGHKLSALNALIASTGPARITVLSRTLQADTALTITGQNIIIDLSGTTITASAKPPIWLIRIVSAKNVAVLNGRLSNGINGFLVDNASDIDISGNRLQGLTENGIVVTGHSSDIDIQGNHLEGLGRAGIMLDGPVTTSLVEGNHIAHMQGHSNWNAGILLTGRGGDIAANPDVFFLADNYWVITQPIGQRLQNPQANVVMDNTISGGLSSGIYNDGGVADVFLGNRIEDNSKEGICFDNGASANVFSNNLVIGNGKRWGQPDAYLAEDSVLGAGRSPDGTSMAKLPGISIDNAIYNEIFANQVIGNYGGGIKMVRTGLFNVIGENVILDNNLGQNAKFHFFGIELGAAPADKPVSDLDFTGSSGNIIFGNSIRGNHYSGIFFGPASIQNDVFDNEIFGVGFFALESVSRQPNYTVNNLTISHSRNIAAGIVPNIAALQAPVYDSP